MMYECVCIWLMIMLTKIISKIQMSPIWIIATTFRYSRQDGNTNWRNVMGMDATQLALNILTWLGIERGDLSKTWIVNSAGNFSSILNQMRQPRRGHKSNTSHESTLSGIRNELRWGLTGDKTLGWVHANRWGHELTTQLGRWLQTRLGKLTCCWGGKVYQTKRFRETINASHFRTYLFSDCYWYSLL